MTDDVYWMEKIDRLKKELASAERYAEDLHHRMKAMEARLARTEVCAKCGAEIIPPTK